VSSGFLILSLHKLNASLGLLATSFAKFCNIGFTFSLGLVLS
jgi:hypothetical protein